MSGLYDLGRQKFLEGGIAILTATIKATIVDTADYTVNLATHEFIDDVPSGARTATATLASKTSTNGVFDAEDTTFTSVTGDESEAIVLWMDTSNEATSPLIAYLDSGVGFAIIPQGGNVVCVWNAAGIFKL